MSRDHRRGFLRLGLAYLTATWLGGCGGGGGSAAPPSLAPPNLASIAVTPSHSYLPVGLTQQFKAVGTYTDGSTSDLTKSALWTSSDPAAASFDTTPGSVVSPGLVRAVAIGETTIVATVGTTSRTVTLDVVPPTVQSISMWPNSFSTGVGIGRQLNATATYSDGHTAVVNSVADWSGSAPLVATVGPNGLVTGVMLGSATVTAVYQGVSKTVVANVTANTWSPAANITIELYGGDAGTLLTDGKFLVSGGLSETFVSIATANAEIYDPDADQWLSTASMATARSGHSATLLDNGLVLVAGGYANTGLASPLIVASAEIYDPNANTWSSAGSMANPRQNHTATLVSNTNKVLVAGGHDGSGSALQSAELYDEITRTWSSAGSMGNPHDNHTATLLPTGKVLVAGGHDSSGSALQSAELYDPATNTWSSAGSMGNPHDNHTATLLPNGKVLVAGGDGGSGSVLQSAELYDPATNTWSPAGSMGNPRENHTATLLPNGKVLVGGGYSPLVGVLKSAELYDPATNTWSAAASLELGRCGHLAILLPNGTTLVVGGAGTTCELYW
jgi:N-acetylneuraminic acid mutarotase